MVVLEVVGLVQEGVVQEVVGVDLKVEEVDQVVVVVVVGELQGRQVSG